MILGRGVALKGLGGGSGPVRLAIDGGYVYSGDGYGGHGAFVTGFDATGADLLVVGIVQSGYDSSITSWWDSESNTYIKIEDNASDPSRLHVWYCLSPSVSSSMDFRGISQNSYPQLIVAAYSGISSLQDSTLANHAGTPPAITAVNANSLAVAYCARIGSTSIDSGFSIINTQGSGGGLDGICMAEKIVGAGSVNPSFDISSSPNAVTALAVFNP